MANPTKSIQVNNVQAADPGIVFQLVALDQNGAATSFGFPLAVTVNVAARAPANNYISSVAIQSIIADQQIVFVIPFGDSNFSSDNNQLSYGLSFQTTSDGQPLNPGNSWVPLTGVVITGSPAGTLPVDAVKSFVLTPNANGPGGTITF